MLTLAVPALSLRLGMPDAGTAAPSSTHRQAYDLMAEGFGPGFNGPLSLVVDTADSLYGSPVHWGDMFRMSLAFDGNSQMTMTLPVR